MSRLFDYLLLNGHHLPVESAAQDDDSTGYEGRTVTGKLSREQIYLKRKWSVTFKWLDLWEAYAYQYLIEGRGHHFPFDGHTYSTKGKGGWTGPISSAVSGAGGGTVSKFGTHHALVASPVTNDFGSAYADSWTVAYWFWTGSAWTHRIETEDGRQWEDGVPASFGWSINMASGVLTLAAGEYDSLVVLPFAITNDMGDEWPLDAAFSDIPEFNATGQLVGNGAIVEGTQTSVAQEQGDDGGVFVPLGKLSFTLREV